MFQKEQVPALFNWDQLKEENAFHQQLIDGLKYTGLFIAIDMEASGCAIG